MALAERSDLDRNPAVGLTVMRSAKSSGPWVEIRIIPPGTRSASWCNRRASSKPLAAEVDVHQGDIGSQPLRLPERLRAVGGHADDHDPLAFEETAGSLQEAGAVVDDEAAQSHTPSIAGGAATTHSR
jgi:hypothetical protein